MKKKEAKIILVNGITISFKEGDKVVIIYEAGNNNYADVEVESVKDIPRLVMNKKGDIVINHSLESCEYMEYYLTRDKITWAYYSEIPEKKDGE